MESMVTNVTLLRPDTGGNTSSVEIEVLVTAQVFASHFVDHSVRVNRYS